MKFVITVHTMPEQYSLSSSSWDFESSTEPLTEAEAFTSFNKMVFASLNSCHPIHIQLYRDVTPKGGGVLMAQFKLIHPFN